MQSQSAAMSLPMTAVSESRASQWTGRVLSALVVLFLVFDGVMKVVQERHVIQAAAELGYPASSMVWIGFVLLACTAIYVIPRTALLGAVLLTGYLGGAVDANVHAGHPVFECVFPIIFGVLAWAGLWLRDARTRSLFAPRKS